LLTEIFDKTIQVRQLDVWEQYGLLVLLLDKGRLCLFKLNELNQILKETNFETQPKNKSFCRGRRIESIQSCNTYSIKKQPLNTNECFKILAACGRRLIILEANLWLNNQSICDTCIASTNPLNEFSSINLNSPSHIESNSSPNLVNDSFNDIVNLFHIKKVIY
jgi:hypothetical protein